MSRTPTSTTAEADAERMLLEPEDAAFDRLPADPSSASDNLSLLAAARERGRLSHALLLAGPRGSGKRWCAVRVAQLLACERPLAVAAGAAGAAGLSACLECGSCARTERGLDPDVLILDLPWDEKKGEAKGEIPVEQVRRLQDRLAFRASGMRRFVIVDPADKLSGIAQEAILKTLEEPPEGVTIALLTTRASFLKPTVRSRSQFLRFAAPSRAALAGFLEAARGMDPAAATLAAALSGGDVRRAQRLDAAEESERWVELARKLYEVLGPRGESHARDLAIAAAALRDGGRDEVAAWLDLVEAIVRDAMVAGEAQEGAALQLVHPGGEKAAAAIARRLCPEAAAEALAFIHVARDDFALNLGAKVVLTWLLLQFHALRTTSAA
jgi:DNA polymerase-3 subunit delta'